MISVTVHLALQLEAMDSYDSLMVLLRTVVTKFRAQRIQNVGQRQVRHRSDQLSHKVVGSNPVLAKNLR